MKVFESHFKGSFGDALYIVAAPDAETAYQVAKKESESNGEWYKFWGTVPEVDSCTGCYIDKRWGGGDMTEFAEIERMSFDTDTPQPIKYCYYIE